MVLEARPLKYNPSEEGGLMMQEGRVSAPMCLGRWASGFVSTVNKHKCLALLTILTPQLSLTLHLLTQHLNTASLSQEVDFSLSHPSVVFTPLAAVLVCCCYCFLISFNKCHIRFSF